MKRKLFFLVLTILLQFSCFSQQHAKFSAQAVKADFEYLYKTLEASHYDLYICTPKKKFDAEYKKIYNSIKDSLTKMQVYKLLQPFTALSNIDHCTLNPPFDEFYGIFIQNGGKLFPINITVNNNKMYIVDDFSKNSNIKNGDELVSIEGKSAKSILDNISLALRYSYNNIN